MQKRSILTNKSLSVSSSESFFIGPQCVANGWLLLVKQRQEMALKAVAESHQLCERASNPQFIINNTGFLLGPDRGNVITLYCPQVVIS